MLFGLAILVLLSLAFNLGYEVRTNTAEVEQIQGLYVFIHSKPVKEYEYLGTFAPGVVPSKDAQKIINYMIKKGKDKYPQADGIIFTDDELGKSDLVKFKE